MVILDPATRQQIPGAAKLFMDPHYPMSASFGGPNMGEIQKVHINPNDSVRLSRDKGRMFRHLEKNGLPVGKNKPMDTFVDGRTFNLPAFEEFFNYEEAPVKIISSKKQQEIAELQELLQFLEHLSKHEGAAATQTRLDVPKSGFIRAIPGADGKSLNIGARAVNDGILAHNIPTNNPKQKDILAGGKEALKKLGLDYGCIFVEFDGKGDFEVLDVVTDLKREDALALRAFADIIFGAQKKPNGKQRI